MYQRDFILRMLEMLGDFLAAIFNLIRKGDYSKASEMLNDTYFTLLKKDASFFQQLPIEGLTDELIHNHNYTNNHIEILAELFYADAELQYAQKKYPLSLDFYKKALLLFQFLEKNAGVYSEARLKKIETLTRKVIETENLL